MCLSDNLSETTMMDVRSLAENPYEPPVSTGNTTRRRSSKPYVWVTLAVTAILTATFATLAWYGQISFKDGQVNLSFDGPPDPGSPYADLTASTYYNIYADTAAVGAMVCIVYVLSIAIANGLVAFWRR